MYKDSIKYKEYLEKLKRTIEITYERYIGERTDAKATLMDLAEFFNIPIDETRITDFVIKSMDFKEPNIEIYDTKTNTSYSAHYTCNADLLNAEYGTESNTIRFNRMKIDNPLAKVDSIYYIQWLTPIKSQMTFTRGDYMLTFEIEEQHAELRGNYGKKYTIRYSKNVDYEDRKIQEPLLTRIYRRYVNEKSNTFEHLFTYNLGYHKLREENQGKYTYAFKDNIIYGIQVHDNKEPKKYIQGICFQNTGVWVKDYLPYSICESDYPRIVSDSDVKACIVFNGCIGSTEDYSDKENLEIYKSDNDIQIKYHIDRLCEFEDKHNPIFDQVVSLPIQTRGKLTLEELQSIVKLLKLIFAGDKFIAIVLQELQIFNEKIKLNEGLVQENLDALSPKLLRDKSFKDIYDEVILNLDTYFDLAEEQFKTNTNIVEEKEIVQSTQDKGPILSKRKK